MYICTIIITHVIFSVGYIVNTPFFMCSKSNDRRNINININ